MRYFIVDRLEYGTMVIIFVYYGRVLKIIICLLILLKICGGYIIIDINYRRGMGGFDFCKIGGGVGGDSRIIITSSEKIIAVC